MAQIETGERDTEYTDEISAEQPYYGLMAEFETPEDLLAAAERAFEAGYRRLDAYTPYPVDGLAEALHKTDARLPLIVLGGGVAGGLLGYGLQYYASVIYYPLNVGGRPLHSWPAFIPVTFELIILFAAFAAVIGMFLLNGLPEPYHPVFNVPGFERASRDSFFLAIETSDTRFNIDETRRFLEALGPVAVTEIEP
jgi:hypothetical protein